MSSQLPLLLLSSKELALIDKVLKSKNVDILTEKLKAAEEHDTTVVNAIKQYTRLLSAVLILNKPNKDTGANKFKFANSISLLLSAKPLIKKLVESRLRGSKFSKNLVTNILLLLVSFIKYPTNLKYQRNYLSVYLTIVASELLVEKFTSFKKYWFLFPLTFAKTWEYYNLDRVHTPGLANRVLDYFCQDLTFDQYPKYLAKKLRLLAVLVPGLALLNYRKTKTLKSLKPLEQSTRLTVVSILVTNLAKYLSSFMVPANSRSGLQAIGFISSLPTVVYFQNNAMWLYLTRILLISMNRKHSIKANSHLNKFRVDKILIISSLLVILTFKDDDQLASKRLLNRITGYINRGNLLI